MGHTSKDAHFKIVYIIEKNTIDEYVEIIDYEIHILTNSGVYLLVA